MSDGREGTLGEDAAPRPAEADQRPAMLRTVHVVAVLAAALGDPLPA